MRCNKKRKNVFGAWLLVGILTMLFGLCQVPMAGRAMAADLELDDQMGGIGSEVTFTLSVNNAPNEVASLGVDIGFDQNVLEYSSADFAGTLMEAWSFKQVNNPEPGVLRLGGFTVGGEIAEGSSGTLVKLTFNIIGDQDGQLPLSDLKDDIATWTTKDGSFIYVEFAIDPASVTICSGASSKFTIVPEGIGEPPFTWSVNDEIVQTGDSRTFEYMFMEAGTYTISVEDSSVPALTAQATATVEAEDDTGELDIPGGSGRDGASVTIPVRIQNAPNEVAALGFDVLFDPSILQFDSFDFAGTLLEGFSFKDVSNPSPGVLRVGGFTVVDPVVAGATGDAVYLTFVVACEDCTSAKLELAELKDDISAWNRSGGCFLACCRCNGDVNGDGEITPIDALCAFEKYLIICPTTCDIPCEDVCCDVNGDGECTPADALCIFQKYLGLPSCLD